METIMMTTNLILLQTIFNEVISTPNDADLGAKIRELFSNQEIQDMIKHK